jgi:hypothetical protein
LGSYAAVLPDYTRQKKAGQRRFRWYSIVVHLALL